MLLNPQLLLDQQVIIPPSNFDPKVSVQQNGIDIDIDQVYQQNESDWLIIGKTQNLFPSKMEMKSPPLCFFPNKQQGFLLRKGNAYQFESSFKVKLQPDMAGWLHPRSSLNRFGIRVESSLYDSGFEGGIGGTIYCFRDVFLEKNARIAQFVVAKADSCKLYNGQWQGQ